MRHLLTSIRFAFLPLCVVAFGARAQSTPTAAAAATGPGHRTTLVMMPIEMNFAQANAVLESDHTLEAPADERLYRELVQDSAYELVDSARVSAALRERTQRTGPCTSDDCLIDFAKSLGADRVLATRITKISTPVWYADTRMLDVTSGKTLRSDQFELKGVPAQIIPEGMRVIARRMSKIPALHP
jgi:hypothetical protein